MKTKPNLKFDINKIRAHKKPLAAGIVGVVLVVAAGALYYAQQQASNKTVDCTLLRQEANQLLKQQKYNESYDKLKPKSEACARPLSESDIKDQAKTEETIQVVQFNAEMAKAAYLAEDKEQAKRQAQQTIDVIEKMSPEQREQIPENERLSLYATIHKIKEDMYRAYMVESDQ